VKALVVGGTGPTGPHIVQGLVERGYDVAILHRGTHEVAELPPVEHIHGDPHFRETIAAALGDRRWDLVVAAYGRVRLLAEALAGRCDRFIGIGGVAAYRGSMDPAEKRPFGMTVLASEDEPLAGSAGGDADAARFAGLVRAAEARVFELHREGAFAATFFRYPSIYGPRQVAPSEWSVIKRVLDGRRRMILPDNGLVLFSRAAARNAAHAVLLAVDHPEAASGEVFNCADDEQFSLRQWMEAIVDIMGGEMEMFSLPQELATPAWPLVLRCSHVLVDTTKIRARLGYRDAVPAMEALRETVEWYRENPVRPEDYPWLRDKFDYDLEDGLMAAYSSAIAAVRTMAPAPPGFVHPYAHPQAPNEGRDHRQR
jgi:nucleoside-diphosphate-sugar epimerase